MDIKVVKEGGIREILDVSEVNDFFSINAEKLLSIEIPITFTGINSGPKGLTHVSIHDVFIADFEIFPIADPSIHRLEHNSAANIISGNTITSPIIFMSENNDYTNTLVLKIICDYTSVNNSLNATNLPPNSSLSIKLSLFFKNSQKLDMEYLGTIKKGSVVSKIIPKSIKRTSPIWLTKINLFSLVVLVGCLILWNSYFNRGVYNADVNFFGQEFITATIAVLATFLGLSVAKIKSFVSLFTQTHSFFRYPELHLSLEQFNGFSSFVWSIVMLLIIGTSSWVIYTHWSVTIPPYPNGYAIYDSDNTEKKIVDTDKYTRIYRRDLQRKNDGHRFNLIVNNSRTSNQTPVELGYIDENGNLIFYKISVAFKTKRGDIRDQSVKNYTAESLLNEHSRKEIFNKILSIKTTEFGNEFDYEFDDVFYTIKFSKIIRDSINIDLKEYKEVGKLELRNMIDSFKTDEFKKPKITSNEIFNKRYSLTNSFVDKFQRILEDQKAIINFQDLLEITYEDLSSELEKKKIIERSIYLVGLWQVYNMNEQTPKISAKDLKSICTQLHDKTIARQSGWRVDRSLMTLLLELNRNSNDLDQSGISLIEKDILEDSDRNMNTIDFLISSAIVDDLGNNKVKDIILNKERIKKIKNRRPDMKLIMNIENHELIDRAGDLVLQEGVVKSRVEQFFNDQQIY